ncbi:hypothetical protein ACH3XW_0780 [Acanthocheilonema viteae]
MKSVLIPSFTLLFTFSMLITAVLLNKSDTEVSSCEKETDSCEMELNENVHEPSDGNDSILDYSEASSN